MTPQSDPIDYYHAWWAEFHRRQAEALGMPAYGEPIGTDPATGPEPADLHKVSSSHAPDTDQ